MDLVPQEIEMPKRNVLNMRPKNAGDGEVYAPQRDVVHLYAGMMAEVIAMLDPERHPTWVKGLIDEEQLVAMMNAFVGIRIKRTHQILIDGLADKRGDRS